MNAPGRRFTDHAPLRPAEVNGLPASHPAIRKGRTLFPSRVKSMNESPRLLISGHNQRKIGDRVTKGAWAGMPIYCLTLEERATCPSSCHHWRTCYGNGMPGARRHMHGPELEARLDQELATLDDQHPLGFVVRLHILGDFYSVDYVKCWRKWLGRFRALRVFGYTAWPPDTPIGQEIARSRKTWFPRFAVRLSSQQPVPMGATTIDRMPEGPVVPEGIVCPAQTDKTACCGSCGLCWSPAAKDKTIVFVLHGQRFLSNG